LQASVLKSINLQLDHFAEFSGISAGDIVKLSVAGNTTMLHLLLGVDPLSIAMAPFTPKFTEAQRLEGKDLNLNMHPQGEVRLLPSVSAYVGADIVAGLASIKPSESRKNYLFLDIGTNGEIALVTSELIFCCSSAAGPAFEGARISCGMGGLEGAISAYDKNGYTVIGDVRPIGICGSGLIDIVAWMVENRLVSSDGLIDSDIVVATADQTFSGEMPSITQQDIREVQLAKSAIAAGVNILLKHANLDLDKIDALYLAGGFGNYINPESAMKIGLISTRLAGKIITVGNTSGTGALLALKSTQFDIVIEDLLKKTEYIELSGHEDFTLEFVMNMMF